MCIFWNFKILREKKIVAVLLSMILLFGLFLLSQLFYLLEEMSDVCFLKVVIKQSQESLDYSKSLLLPIN